MLTSENAEHMKTLLGSVKKVKFVIEKFVAHLCDSYFFFLEIPKNLEQNWKRHNRKIN